MQLPQTPHNQHQQQPSRLDLIQLSTILTSRYSQYQVLALFASSWSMLGYYVQVARLVWHSCKVVPLQRCTCAAPAQ